MFEYFVWLVGIVIVQTVSASIGAAFGCATSVLWYCTLILMIVVCARASYLINDISRPNLGACYWLAVSSVFGLASMIAIIRLHDLPAVILQPELGLVIYVLDCLGGHVIGRSMYLYEQRYFEEKN